MLQHMALTPDYTLSQRNLALWRQVDTSSERLLSMVIGSAAAITIFSVRHRSHLMALHLYGAACLPISHLTSPDSSKSLSSHMYLDSSVSIQRFFSLNEQV